MAFLDLDPDQIRAVCRPVKGRSIIVAGPGSGKTRCLTARAVYTRMYGDPEKIVLCVSFTTKASEEIKRRLKKIVDRKEVKAAFAKLGKEDKLRYNFWTGTLHSLAKDMLCDLVETFWHKIPEEEQEALHTFSPGLFSALLGKDLNKALITDSEVEQLWEECQNKLRRENKIPPKPSRYERRGDVIRSVWKARACALEEGIELPDFILEGTIPADNAPLQKKYAILRDEARIANEYFLYKRDHGRVDFDDLLILAGTMLRHSPTMFKHWESHLGHLLIDEAQDLSSVDWYFLRSLPGFDKGSESSVGYTLIGDPRQEIYGFRSSDNDDGILWKLLTQQTWADQISYLNVNYRSGSSIVGLSHKIAQNKRLYMNYEPDEVKKSHAKSVPERGRGHVGWHLLNRRTDAEVFLMNLAKNLTTGDRAILTRTNQQAMRIRQLLKEKDIEGFEVSTIHLAKGKEWDHVIVTGLGPGRFPTATSPWTTEALNMRSEARLLYVAVTRAKESIQVMEPDTGEFYPTLELLSTNR